MTSLHDLQFNEEDAEQLLRALAGVVSAHIVIDGTGQMAEIHILASPDLHPKQVVRNVESALSAGLGIEVDRRIVSVAQIRSELASAPPGSAGAVELVTRIGDEQAPMDPPAPAADTETNRLEYVRYQSRRDAERCTCEVVLRSGGEEISGTGTGPDTEAGRAEAAARAVFGAIMRARPRLRIELEGAVISNSRGQDYVIVSAHTLLERATLPLAGAAALGRSPEEAAILAALQATNRWSG